MSQETIELCPFTRYTGYNWSCNTLASYNRHLFWTRNLYHFKRILVWTFIFVNGLNPIVFNEWMLLMNLCKHQAAINHVLVVISPLCFQCVAGTL